MEGVFIPEQVLTHPALGSNDKIVMGQLLKMSDMVNGNFFEFTVEDGYRVLDCHKFTMLKILQRLAWFKLIQIKYIKSKGQRVRVRMVRVPSEEIKGGLPASFTPKLECNTL